MTDDNKKRGPGRPTEKRKDTILRLRIDTDTHRKLSECAAVRQVSMSELVREAIDEIFRREKEKQQKNFQKNKNNRSMAYTIDLLFCYIFMD